MPRDVLKEILGVKAKQERGWDHRKALMHQCILIYINVIMCVCGLGREEVDDETEGWMLELLELMQLQAVRKTHLFCAVLYYTNTIFLPSQARDKHREIALKTRGAFFLGQAFGGEHHWSRGPTAAEFRAMSYLGMVRRHRNTEAVSVSPRSTFHHFKMIGLPFAKTGSLGTNIAEAHSNKFK